MHVAYAWSINVKYVCSHSIKENTPSSMMAIHSTMLQETCIQNTHISLRETSSRGSTFNNWAQNKFLREKREIGGFHKPPQLHHLLLCMRRGTTRVVGIISRENLNASLNICMHIQVRARVLFRYWTTYQPGTENARNVEAFISGPSFSMRAQGRGRHSAGYAPESCNLSAPSRDQNWNDS